MCPVIKPVTHTKFNQKEETVQFMFHKSVKRGPSRASLAQAGPR